MRRLELNAPARLLLPRPVESLRAFDLMGNEVPVATGQHGIEVSLAAERPIYLRCRGGDRAVLEEALAAAKMIDLDAVAVTARPAARGGVQVTLTGRSRTAQDGVVEVLPSAAAAPAEWPAPRHFHSLACGESRSLNFVLPANTTAREVRVRVGDRDIQKFTPHARGDDIRKGSNMDSLNRTVFSRRRLLKGAAALAAVTIVPRAALGGPAAQAPSEKPALAGVGVGGVGYGQLPGLRKGRFSSRCPL